ncbi:MAG: RNA polymerase sigma factor [Planctomycetota bacterium]|nr:MAG: RNA polymerase sigma factor [Planctomycetota bacterium]
MSGDAPEPPADDITRSLELVERAQDGDLQAYNRIFERYYDRVLRICRIRLGPHMRQLVDAEDILQETFIAAIKTFERFEMRHEASLIAWLSRLAENKIREAVDYHHAQKRDKRKEKVFTHISAKMASGSLQFDPPASIMMPGDRVAQNELLQVMDECMQELTDAHREVIIARLYAKGDWAWVAEQIGRPTEGAARELFRRAKFALINKVSERIDIPE